MNTKKDSQVERESFCEETTALRQACWDARAIMGFDNDGDPTPAAQSYPPMAQLIVRDAREFRQDYDDACADRERVAARCESLEKERDAAFAMSKCECASDEACKNLVWWKEWCEGLEKLLRNCRDNYVEPMLRSERIAFKGNENCSDIANIESDLAAINAALSPPASDAADSTDGETK